jgi:hypothetical protein
MGTLPNIQKQRIVILLTVDEGAANAMHAVQLRMLRWWLNQRVRGSSTY